MSYDVRVDGYRYNRFQQFLFLLVGFCLGWIGVLIDWAIAHRKRMMECSAEGIWIGIIGWATSVVCWFVLTAVGVLEPSANIIAIIVFGALPVVLGYFGIMCALPDTILVTALIDGWAISLLVIAILFIFLAEMWVYGLRHKMTL